MSLALRRFTTVLTAASLAFVLLSTCLLSPVWATSLADLAPFTGIWHGGTDDDWREEILGAPRGGMLLGSSHFVEHGKTTFFEFFKIVEQNGALILQPQPGGEPGEPFPLREASASRLVFENPALDFPRVIAYELTAPDRLMLRIEGLRDGQPTTWQFDYRRR